MLRERPVARLPASDLYSVASGDTVFAGGEPILVTRREAYGVPTSLFSFAGCILRELIMKVVLMINV